MAISNKDVSICEVQSRHPLWRDNDVNFRRKDVTSKLWEIAAVACGMTNGK